MKGYSPSRFKTLPRAYHYAANCARVQRRRWWVVRRHGGWYALPPEMAEAVRGNSNWPGASLDT